MRDVVIIGSGLAGLTAAARLAGEGREVTLLTKGLGGLQLGQGTIDLLGYYPSTQEEGKPGIREFVSAPLELIDTIDLNDDGSDHPYRHFSADDVKEAVEWFKGIMGEDLVVGDGTRNYRLPTAVGALRPTALPQPTMVQGEPDGRPMVLVGFDRLKDFYPDLIAENLRRQMGPDGKPIEARALHIDLVVDESEMDTSGLQFARALDKPEMRQQLCDLLRPLLKNTGRPDPDGEPTVTRDPRNLEVVGFPAVLGLSDKNAFREIAEGLGHDVFEIPIQPPSVPGMRFSEHLTRMVKAGATEPEQVALEPGQAGAVAGKAVRVIMGVPVIGFDVDTEGEEQRITSVTIASAGHPRKIAAREFILAAGGFESGSLQMDSYGKVSEKVFDLPLVGAEGEMIHGDYWGKDQPLFRAGVRVDAQMRPLDQSGQPVYTNLHAAGGIIGGSVRWREKSGDGIALVTGLRAADAAGAAATVTAEASAKDDNDGETR